MIPGRMSYRDRTTLQRTGSISSCRKFQYFSSKKKKIIIRKRKEAKDVGIGSGRGQCEM